MKLWRECNSYGIKPIVGCEFYFAPSSHAEKSPIYWGEPHQRSDDVGNQGAYTHGTLLATNDEGLRNLFRLYATSYADGFYRKPRIDIDLLGSHRAGIIVTTGCAGGAIPTLIRLEKLDEARAMLGKMRDIFGDNLFLEIMEHDNPIDRVINPHLIQLSKYSGVSLLATNDSHYTLESDKYAQDALLCLQTGQKVNGPRKFQFEGTGYHLKSYQEMAQLSLEPEWLKETLAVAERVEPYTLFDHNLRMPKSKYEDGDAELLRRLQPLDNQLAYELQTIIQMEYSDCFLILADLLAKARARGIRIGPGRGSAAGSRASYKLGITTVDPDEHGLLFERFLNPERISLPDFDIDIDDRRRDEFLGMVREEYGEEFVTQLGTTGTIGAKSALHDSARVLGYARRLSDGLTYRLPAAKFGRQPALSEGDWSGLSAEEREVLELAQSLEGRTRNQGIHAAGVVISPEPLADILPIYKPKGTEPWVTAFDMTDVEKLGLLKMDFLGLQNLGVIDDCLAMLQKGPNQPPELRTTLEGLADPATYALLSKGETLGVFQLDSPGMQQLLRSVKPDQFGDIASVLALYRPGPMAVNAHHSYAKRKAGKERVSYPHGELERDLAGILGSTYGLVVFQEQVLEILKTVGGYTYSSAALIFDAMRKKDTKKMLEAKPDFMTRMKERGYSQECTVALWDTLVPFSDYSFGKAHSTGYGIFTYWTAYLKANHPNEYMAALLTAEKKPEKMPVYLQEVARMGIPVLPPDINESTGSWTPSQSGIRYGLSSIKGLKETAYNYIKMKRPYRSLHDFFARARREVLNARVLGALIQSGALDSLCPHREELYAASEALAQRALAERGLAKKGQLPLYSQPYGVNSIGAFDSALRQTWERELLGTVLTHEEIVLRPTRWLHENEFYFIREVSGQHPGRQRLSLALGYATIEVGYVDYNDTLRRQLKSLGVFPED